MCSGYPFSNSQIENPIVSNNKIIKQNKLTRYFHKNVKLSGLKIESLVLARHIIQDINENIFQLQDIFYVPILNCSNVKIQKLHVEKHYSGENISLYIPNNFILNDNDIKPNTIVVSIIIKENINEDYQLYIINKDKNTVDKIPKSQCVILSDKLVVELHIAKKIITIIENPSKKISCTNITSSLLCLRKSVLNFLNTTSGTISDVKKYKVGSDKTETLYDNFNGVNPLIYGKMFHNVFQNYLISTTTDTCLQPEQETLLMKRLIDEEFTNVNYLFEAFNSDSSLIETKRKLRARIPAVIKWRQNYYSSYAKNLSCQKTPSADSTKMPLLKYSKVYGREISISYDTLGLKGILDLVVSDDNKDLILLELKTGKMTNGVEHEGQVMLYQHLLREYVKKTETTTINQMNYPSYLLYLDGEEFNANRKSCTKNNGQELHNTPSSDIVCRSVKSSFDKASSHHIRALLERRNLLASHLDWRRDYITSIPEPINNARVCRWCPQLFTCALVGQLERQTHLSHVNSPQQSSNNMDTVIDNTYIDLFDENPIEDIEELFSTPPDKNTIPRELSEMWLHNTKHLTPKDVKYFKDWFEILWEEVNPRLNTATTQIQYSITTSLLYAGFGNVLQLLKPSPESTMLRNMVIHHELSRQSTNCSEQEKQKAKPLNFDTLYEKKLNSEQRDVIRQACEMSQGILIVEGYPGAGKTETIIHLIHAFALKLGKSCLIVSHTNSAIDNIFKRLIALDDDIKNSLVRFGSTNSQKIDSQLHEYVLENRIKKAQSAQKAEAIVISDPLTALINVLQSCSIFGTTCANFCNDLVAQKLRYDVCIMDEASQISEPLALGPLFNVAHVSVMFGDSAQLTPIFRSNSKHSSSHLRNQSLFQHLIDLVVAARDMKTDNYSISLINICKLTTQYRMNKRILQLSNHLIYDFQLKCDETSLSAYSTIDPAVMEALSNLKTHPWLSLAFDSMIERSIIFLDTKNEVSQDKLSGIAEILRAKEITTPKSSMLQNTVNLTEVYVIHAIVEALQCIGSHIFPLNRLAILAPYNDQIEAITQCLPSSHEQIECSTIDKFQGKDKEVIIFSFTKQAAALDASGSPKKKIRRTDDILSDIKRLNVAFTRAKHKLIMVGDYQFLTSRYEMLSNVFKHVLAPKDILNIM